MRVGGRLTKEDIYVYNSRFTTLYSRNEHNVVNLLYPNYKINNKIKLVMNLGGKRKKSDI